MRPTCELRKTADHLDPRLEYPVFLRTQPTAQGFYGSSRVIGTRDWRMSCQSLGRWYEFSERRSAKSRLSRGPAEPRMRASSRRFSVRQSKRTRDQARRGFLAPIVLMRPEWRRRGTAAFGAFAILRREALLQHDVWVGRHERCERAEITRQFEKSREASGHKR